MFRGRNYPSRIERNARKLKESCEEKEPGRQRRAIPESEKLGGSSEPSKQVVQQTGLDVKKTKAAEIRKINEIHSSKTDTRSFKTLW